MTLHTFYLFLIIMAVVALAVYVSLFFVDAGYGKFYDPKWGPAARCQQQTRLGAHGVACVCRHAAAVAPFRPP